ncbi:hypothetical protein [Croceicoccus naphthovorans]|uniref:Uncharacterized protein n=1 Tax=Croceicoccus naphthovorans TaxID=1348774 RepID=A0A0G3XIW1_9SPHN|nr:hypothetical protein [Croceicoccus naphthovorans]AKM11122.1 hypothetical protein AB433_15905 [Croceicoccus naphthovorans]MBB3989429.1 hypothetical protein [Croceicoccus naphthovorans]
MSAIPDFPTDDMGTPTGCEEDVLSARWAAMHRSADALAKMLGPQAGPERNYSLYPVGLPQHDRTELEAGTADLCAMMELGVYAILQAREHGAEAKVAAKALLRRFEDKRRRLLSEVETEADLAA